MKAPHKLLNRIVAAVLLIFFGTAPLFAQTAVLDGLFSRLLTVPAEEAPQIEREIWREWGKSGSPAMDLLLERGEKAMEQGDLEAAIEHLTALTDRAPDFAEGWNQRATAYFQAGKLGPSLADIQRTLALNPRHFGALAGFGIVLEELGQKQQAMEVYHKALAIHPHLAGVLEALRRLDETAAGQEL